MSQKPIPTDPEQAVSRKPGRRTLIIGAIVLIFACGICGLITTFFGDPAPAEETAGQPEATAEVVAAVEEAPTDTPAPEPTDIPAPTPTTPPVATDPPADPVAALRSTIDTALGESNRGLGRKLNLFEPGPGENTIVIGWAADDNFSTNMIVGAMQLDTVEVLKSVDQSGIVYDQVFIGSTFAMQDQFGNPSEMEVLTLAYNKETLDRINWDNFIFSNVFDIADLFILHPAFEED